jgi:hypothetical protein
MDLGSIYTWIRRQVGLRTDEASSTGSLHAKVTEARNTLNTAITNKSAIRQVQRGTYQNTNANIIETVTISLVTPSKCDVRIHIDGGQGAREIVLTATSLSWYATLSTAYIDWQVIEYE